MTSAEVQKLREATALLRGWNEAWAEVARLLSPDGPGAPYQLWKLGKLIEAADVGERDE